MSDPRNCTTIESLESFLRETSDLARKQEAVNHFLKIAGFNRLTELKPGGGHSELAKTILQLSSKEDQIKCVKHILKCQIPLQTTIYNILNLNELKEESVRKEVLKEIELALREHTNSVIIPNLNKKIIEGQPKLIKLKQIHQLIDELMAHEFSQTALDEVACKAKYLAATKNEETIANILNSLIDKKYIDSTSLLDIQKKLKEEINRLEGISKTTSSEIVQQINALIASDMKQLDAGENVFGLKLFSKTLNDEIIKPSVQTEIIPVNTIANFPTEKTSLSTEQTLTISCHGDPLAILRELVRYNIIDMDDNDYQHLSSIYNKKIEDLTPTDVERFKEIINRLPIIDQRNIRLLGNVLSCNGQNDLFTLLLLNHLTVKKVPIAITMSNHDAAFVAAYEKDKNRAENPESEIGLDRSLRNLRIAIKNNLSNADELDDIVKNAYLTHLKLIDYSKDKTTLTLYTAPAMGTDIIHPLCKEFNIKTPQEGEPIDKRSAIIDAINENITHSIIDGTFSQKYTPSSALYQAISERVVGHYELVNRWVAQSTENVNLRYVHNTDGITSISERHKHITSLGTPNAQVVYAYVASTAADIETPRTITNIEAPSSPPPPSSLQVSKSAPSISGQKNSLLKKSVTFISTAVPGKNPKKNLMQILNQIQEYQVKSQFTEFYSKLIILYKLDEHLATCNSIQEVEALQSTINSINSHPNEIKALKNLLQVYKENKAHYPIPEEEYSAELKESALASQEMLRMILQLEHYNYPENLKSYNEKFSNRIKELAILDEKEQAKNKLIKTAENLIAEGINAPDMKKINTDLQKLLSDIGAARTIDEAGKLYLELQNYIQNLIKETNKLFAIMHAIDSVFKSMLGISHNEREQILPKLNSLKEKRSALIDNEYLSLLNVNVNDPPNQVTLESMLQNSVIKDVINSSNQIIQDQLLQHAQEPGTTEVLNEVLENCQDADIRTKLEKLQSQITLNKQAAPRQGKSQKSIDEELADIEKAMNESNEPCYQRLQQLFCQAKNMQDGSLNKFRTLYERSSNIVTDTLMDMCLTTLSEINAYELYNYDVNKDPRPSMEKLGALFNKVSMYIINDILNRASIDERTLAIDYWIRIAEKCLNYTSINNLMLLYAINAALNSASIHRLNHTYAGLPDYSKKLIASFTQLTSHEGNSKNCREYMNSHPGCVPYPGVILSGLVFYMEGNPKTKKWSSSFFYEQVEQFRQIIKNAPSLQVKLSSCAQLKNAIDRTTPGKAAEDNAYALSRALEPKDSATLAKSEILTAYNPHLTTVPATSPRVNHVHAAKRKTQIIMSNQALASIISDNFTNHEIIIADIDAVKRTIQHQLTIYIEKARNEYLSDPIRLLTRVKYGIEYTADDISKDENNRIRKNLVSEAAKLKAEYDENPQASKLYKYLIDLEKRLSNSYIANYIFTQHNQAKSAEEIQQIDLILLNEYANDICINSPHHFEFARSQMDMPIQIRDRELMDDPAINKVLAALYLVMEPSYEESKDKTDIIKLYIRMLNNDELNHVYSLITSPLLSKKLPQTIKSYIFQRKNNLEVKTDSKAVIAKFMANAIMRNIVAEVDTATAATATATATPKLVAAYILVGNPITALAKSSAVNDNINPLHKLSDSLVSAQSVKDFEITKWLITKDQATALIEIAKFSEIEIANSIAMSMNEINKYYELAPLLEFASHIGMQTESNWNTPEIVSHEIQAFLIEKMRIRQKACLNLATDIKLRLKSELLYKIITENPEYFLSGQYQFNTKATPFGEFKKADQRHKKINKEIYKNLSSLLTHDDPHLFELVFANTKLMDKLKGRGKNISLLEVKNRYKDACDNHFAHVYKQMGITDINALNTAISNWITTDLTSASTLEQKLVLFKRWAYILSSPNNSQFKNVIYETLYQQLTSNAALQKKVNADKEIIEQLDKGITIVKARKPLSVAVSAPILPTSSSANTAAIAAAVITQAKTAAPGTLAPAKSAPHVVTSTRKPNVAAKPAAIPSIASSAIPTAAMSPAYVNPAAAAAASSISTTTVTNSPSVARVSKAAATPPPIATQQTTAVNQQRAPARDSHLLSSGHSALFSGHAPSHPAPNASFALQTQAASSSTAPHTILDTLSQLDAALVGILNICDRIDNSLDKIQELMQAKAQEAPRTGLNRK